ncbi:MAG: hypothetical protein ACI9OJ_002862, partial [Myxococcota bacterium]
MQVDTIGVLLGQALQVTPDRASESRRRGSPRKSSAPRPHEGNDLR